MHETLFYGKDIGKDYVAEEFVELKKTFLPDIDTKSRFTNKNSYVFTPIKLYWV